MKKFAPFLGLFLIIIGTLALVLTRLEQLSNLNTLLLAGLLFIILGIVLHIRSIKQQDNY
jgi:uncharacterized membrane protein HdeD (DUF308 family)